MLQCLSPLLPIFHRFLHIFEHFHNLDVGPAMPWSLTVLIHKTIHDMAIVKPR